MFLILWLILGVVTVTVLGVSNFRAANIESTFLRRSAIVAIVTFAYPAYVILSALDNFLQALDFDYEDKPKTFYVKAFFMEITTGLYEEAKGAW